MSKKVLESINKPVDTAVVKKIASDLSRYSYNQCEKETPSAQDRGIYSLLEPTRLLDLVRNFIIYDNGIKKVTRYQQYFAIKKTIAKIKKPT